jgi:hypothetical protein
MSHEQAEDCAKNNRVTGNHGIRAKVTSRGSSQTILSVDGLKDSQSSGLQRRR